MDFDDSRPMPPPQRSSTGPGPEENPHDKRYSNQRTKRQPRQDNPERPYVDQEEERTEDGDDGEASSDDDEGIVKQRRRLLIDIQRGKIKINRPVRDEVIGRIRKCIRDGEEDQKTLLHNIIIQVRTFGTKSFPQYKELARLALEMDPDLLTESGYHKETALHLAIGKRMGSFAKHLCESSKSLQEAIRCTKEDGTTCLHLAIELELSTADYFVIEADEETLKMKKNNGNTALHEAVDFTRCKSSQLDLVKKIVKGWPKAIGELNKAGKSPYQYHLETRASSRTSQNQPAAMEINSNPLKTDYIKKSVTEFNAKIDNGNENGVQKKSTKNPQFREGIQDSDLAARSKKKGTDSDGGKQDGAKARKIPTKNEPPSEQVARDIEHFLKDQCLVDKSFEEAVTCIFGSARSTSSMKDTRSSFGIPSNHLLLLN
jgi:hypothetical protein